MKTLLNVLLAGLMLAFGSQAQTQLYISQAPPPSILTIAQTGQVGPTTYCYWVVAVYTGGKSAPAGPLCTSSANATLSSTNYNTVTFSAPTSPILAVSSYDLLRTTTQTPPSGACACAVSTAQSGSPLNDQSNTLSAYTVATLAATGASVFGDSITTSGSVYYRMNIDGVKSLAVQNPASVVNFLQIDNAATGSAVGLEATGTDGTVALNLKTKSTAGVQVNGTQVFDSFGTANTGVTGASPVYSAYGNATTAQINTGLTILADNANRTIKVLHVVLQAIGGAAATCTVIAIGDTNSVVAVSQPVANLTQNTITTEGTASANLTTFQTALTAGKGLSIFKTGSSCATLTSANYQVLYTYQ